MLNDYLSNLYAAFVQILLYGIYITTLARWLILDDKCWKLGGRVNWSMLVISVITALVRFICV